MWPEKPARVTFGARVLAALVWPHVMRAPPPCPSCSAVILGDTRPKVCRWDKNRGYQHGQMDSWPRWSSELSSIPLTWDEQLERERMKATGQTEMERLQPMAMAAQLGIPVPQALAAHLGGIQALEAMKAEPQVICADGHANRPGARFCDLCGTSMQVTAETEASVA